MPQMEEKVMTKDLYEKLEVELIRFESTDVIITSEEEETPLIPDPKT